MNGQTLKRMTSKGDLTKQITPIGLVPLATGTAFLILGARGSASCPGHPSLPSFLLIAGTLTVGLGVMTVIGKFIVTYGLPSSGRQLTPEERAVLALLKSLRHLLSLSQICVLIGGTIVIAPLATAIHPWNFTDTKDPMYCDYGTVVFSAIFFPLTWALLVFSSTAYLFIRCSYLDGETELVR